MDKAKWWTAVENPLAVTSIYWEPPKLTEVEITRLELDLGRTNGQSEGWATGLPGQATTRRRRYQHNAAILELRLFAISQVRLSRAQSL
jgi:hypothetical protein